MRACRRRPAPDSIRRRSPASKTSSAASSAISSAAAGRGGPERGSDLRYDLEITFEESAKGVETTDRYPAPRDVRHVPRLGRRARHAARRPARSARDAGSSDSSRGSSPSRARARAARERAASSRSRAPTCKGEGRTTKERKLTVKIPAGIADGQRLRISGEGEGGLHGGPPGDLYVFIEVAPHRVLPPRRQQPVVRDSAELHDARARRQHRRADARRTRVVQGARRHAVGHASSVFAARACRTCPAAAAAICSSPCRR